MHSFFFQHDLYIHPLYHEFIEYSKRLEIFKVIEHNEISLDFY